MKNFWNWLITSSADPEKTSATAKGVLKIILAQATQLLTLSCSAGIYCLAGDLSWLNDVIDLVGGILYATLMLWGSLQGLYGILRKRRLGRWSAAQM